ncbi:glycosyltransferase family 4 protein [Adhaeribacter radiodurans]|uniref:Glycosyltransferase family 4 protein n=1 Tax=Adhaeribacter radiodurans TaxID=2745197 RepID=A0A7L7L3I8_9BACT|nr:glycosyltransferase family 4 protein [Adhaeribacter radiodurans]QMU27344.1 glycosyltransferase family 4 protein [Adhaeribacter radiodurans]
MRILYIHQYFITPNEPGGTRSYWFAKELIANGHQVVMLTSRNKQQELVEKKLIDGIEVIYVKNPYSNNMGIISRLWSFFRFMLLSTWLGLRQKNIDLVYATSTPLSIGIPALAIKQFKGIPYIFEVRDLWPEVPIQMGAIKSSFIIKLLNWFEKKIYTSAKHVVALSPGMRDGVIKTGITPNKVTMIPNMAKKDEFFVRAKNWEVARTFNLNTNHFNVVHFGAMGIANGLEYLVKAAAVLKEQSIHNIDFVFLGEGKTEADLKKICESQHLTNVKFLGKHPMKIVSEIVNICDCSMVSFSDIPILYTNSPNKLFDSLSAGKPLIVNSAGWTKEMVEKHNCGVYVDPQKPEDLANMLIKMAANPVWLQEMSVNSRRLAEEVYDKTILCKKFVNVIEAYNVQKPAETFS